MLESCVTLAVWLEQALTMAVSSNIIDISQWQSNSSSPPHTQLASFPSIIREENEIKLIFPSKRNEWNKITIEVACRCNCNRYWLSCYVCGMASKDENGAERGVWQIPWFFLLIVRPIQSLHIDDVLILWLWFKWCFQPCLLARLMILLVFFSVFHWLSHQLIMHQ